MATAATDFAGIDESAVDQPVDNSQVDTGDINPEQGAIDGTGGGTQPQVDGRRGPTDIRTAAKSIAEAIADPTSDLAAKFPGQEKAVKALADSYFRADAYAKVFPKVEDAQAAKTFIDTVGGIDGFQGIQQRMQAYDAQDNGLRDGDPAALDSPFKEFPEGMAALAPHFLDRLGKSNPDALNNAIAPHIMAMLDRAQVSGHLQGMARETDPAMLKQMAGELDQWMKQQRGRIEQLQQKPQVNPLEGKLKERETALSQKEEQYFTKQVDSAVTQSSMSEIQKTVEQYAKTYKLNDTQKNRFMLSVTQRVVDEAMADPIFKKQDDIRKASKDVDKVASFRSTEFLRRLPNTAFKEAQELWGANKGAGQQTGVVKPGGPKTAPGGGPLLVSRPPQISELDMRKDPRQLLYIQNKGYRPDGTFITWK
jgi:ribosomal protein S20